MDYIYIGKIVNTHGIRGEVRILSNFRYKDKLFVKGMNIYIGKDRVKEVISGYRPHKNFDMIFISSYNNINDVLKYKGCNVFVCRDDIKLDDNCYFDEDLIGLHVIIDNKDIGVIKSIELNYKQYLFVVEYNKKDCLIPYVSDIIEKIDLDCGCIIFRDIKGLI